MPNDTNTPGSGASPFPTSASMGAAPGGSGAAGTWGTTRASTTGAGSDGQPEPLELVAQGMHAAVDSIAEEAAQQTQQLKSTVAGAADRVHQQADHLRATGDEWVECLRVTVREHPLGAIATALALGMLVARLSR